MCKKLGTAPVHLFLYFSKSLSQVRQIYLQNLISIVDTERTVHFILCGAKICTTLLLSLARLKLDYGNGPFSSMASNLGLKCLPVSNIRDARLIMG